MRHVIVPQAVRRVVPPLLNDFISLQKDVALVSILGPQEAFRVAQIERGLRLQLHALHRRGAPLPAGHGAAGPDRRPPAGQGAPAPGAGRGDVTAPPVLELRGVTKAYGDREVLRGIDLAVGEHRAVALIGASGSGKSTLLRCVDLLEEIDEGDVFLDGEVITDPSRRPVAVRRRLGLVFQAFNLFPHMTVLQNVDPRAGAGPRARRARRPASAPARSWPASAWPAARTTTPTASPAASSSASPSSAPWPPARAPCCSTRSPAPSTPSSWGRSST